MLSSLPNLSPRDSQALWYTPLHSSSHITLPIETASHAFDPLNPNQHSATHPQAQRRNAHPSRTPLGRLRADELYLARRKNNVSNYGASWIKPPGLTKSLHQLREERREMEEHEEALRREHLAQELAAAEAGEDEDDDLLQADDTEARDLDDDIPEAEMTGLDPESEEDEENDTSLQRGVIAQRLPEDVFREALIRGEEIQYARSGNDGASEGDASQLLQEEDLGHDHSADDLGMGMDMDADLDSVPEAEAYEHTDTEEELDSSDEDDDESVDRGRLPGGGGSLVRSDGTMNSMDLSIMERGSSPRVRRARMS